MSNFDNMHIKFNWVLENKEVDLKQEGAGTVYTQNEKYHLEFMGNIFMYDNENTYMIITDDEEINILDGKSDDNMLNPTKLLFFYKEGFTYEWSATQTVNKRKIQSIKLIPIDSESEASFFVVGVDIDSKLIYSIEQVGNNGTITTFKIEEFKSNIEIPADLFTFNEAKFKEQNYTINK